MILSAARTACVSFALTISYFTLRSSFASFLSKEVLTNLLREKLSFNGLIVTDATAMIGYNVALPRSQAIPLSIENGCDMILFNKDIDEDYTFMKKGLENGLLSL